MLKKSERNYDTIVKLVDAANGKGAEAEPIITKKTRRNSFF